MYRNQEKSGMIKRKLLPAILFIVIFLLCGVAAMLLWNALLPQIIQVTTINYWQALGLMLLGRILFGRFKFGPGSWRGENGPRHLLKDKLMTMDETDRASFREEWRKRCGERG